MYATATRRVVRTSRRLFCGKTCKLQASPHLLRSVEQIFSYDSIIAYPATAVTPTYVIRQHERLRPFPKTLLYRCGTLRPVTHNPNREETRGENEIPYVVLRSCGAVDGVKPNTFSWVTTNNTRLFVFCPQILKNASRLQSTQVCITRPLHTCHGRCRERGETARLERRLQR